jgi:hypothetical protein
MKTAKLICICGEETVVNMIGNNNADGKSICDCGRNITVHLRRNKRRKSISEEQKCFGCGEYDCRCADYA